MQARQKKERLTIKGEASLSDGLRRLPSYPFSLSRSLMLIWMLFLLSASGCFPSSFLALRHQYLSLLCQFSPDEVRPYLMSHTDYHLDHALAVCRQWELVSNEGMGGGGRGSMISLPLRQKRKKRRRSAARHHVPH